MQLGGLLHRRSSRSWQRYCQVCSQPVWRRGWRWGETQVCWGVVVQAELIEDDGQVQWHPCSIKKKQKTSD